MKEQLVYVDRQNTGSVKWDGMKEKYGRDDLLCLWVADMDFKSPRCVQEALQRQIDCGAYGYSILGAASSRIYRAEGMGSLCSRSSFCPVLVCQFHDRCRRRRNGPAPSILSLLPRH